MHVVGKSDYILQLMKYVASDCEVGDMARALLPTGKVLPSSSPVSPPSSSSSSSAFPSTLRLRVVKDMLAMASGWRPSCLPSAAFCRPHSSVSCAIRRPSSQLPAGGQVDDVWEQLRREALEQSEAEPYLASYFYATVLAHPSLERSLAFHLANKLANPTLLSTQLFALFWETFAEDSEIQEALRSDIKAFKERDPACTSYVHGMLNFKGYLACEAHRIAHRLWGQGRYALALALQNRISEVFQVDIHPGAQIGKGVLFDHATGVVIGETAVIGDNVSILHHVTLGGTGNCCGIRHPKIGNGVLIGAAAILLGPIEVGDGAKIGACSLVLMDVPSYTTAVGVPARILRTAPPDKKVMPALSMDHTSLILDYMI